MMELDKLIAELEAMEPCWTCGDDFNCVKQAASALREQAAEIQSLRAELAEAKAILQSPELLEKLAAIEHERWSGWMVYQEKLSMDSANWARWKVLRETPYTELPEHSKESDRIEARKTLAAILAAMQEVK